MPTASKPHDGNGTHNDCDGGSRDRPVGRGETEEPCGFERLVPVRCELAGRDLGRAIVRLGPCVVPRGGCVVEQAIGPVRGGLADSVRVEMARGGVDRDLRLERVGATTLEFPISRGKRHESSTIRKVVVFWTLS